MAELVLGGALQGRHKEGADTFASQMCDISLLQMIKERLLEIGV